MRMFERCLKSVLVSALFVLATVGASAIGLSSQVGASISVSGYYTDTFGLSGQLSLSGGHGHLAGMVQDQNQSLFNALRHPRTLGILANPNTDKLSGVDVCWSTSETPLQIATNVDTLGISATLGNASATCGSGATLVQDTNGNIDPMMWNPYLPFTMDLGAMTSGSLSWVIYAVVNASGATGFSNPLTSSGAYGSAVLTAGVPHMTPYGFSDFTGTGTSAWTSLGGACLTATQSQFSVSGVAGCADNYNGDGTTPGVLRLTDANGSIGVSTVWNNQIVSSGQPLDVSFTTYEWGSGGQSGWNGGPADGEGILTAAIDPSTNALPSTQGWGGGGLGFQNLTNGYMDFGLDAYGNFDGLGRSGVALEGPGYGSDRLYSAPAALNLASATTRSGSAVHVEFVLNTSSSTVVANTTQLQVPAGQYLVAYQPIGAGGWVTKTGWIPTARAGQPGYDAYVAANIPASYLDPSTGYPKELSWGFAGATGAGYETNEIQFDSISALAVTPINLSTISAGNFIGAPLQVVAPPAPALQPADAVSSMSVSLSGSTIEAIFGAPDSGASSYTCSLLKGGQVVATTNNAGYLFNSSYGCSFTNVAPNTFYGVSVVASNANGGSNSVTNYLLTPAGKSIRCRVGKKIRTVTGLAPHC